VDGTTVAIAAAVNVAAAVETGVAFRMGRYAGVTPVGRAAMASLLVGGVAFPVVMWWLWRRESEQWRGGGSTK